MIKIKSKIISESSPVFVIAEGGVNHNGKLSLAKKLVDAAKVAGADAVKFQTFKAEGVVIGSVKMASYQEKNTGKKQSQLAMIKKLELDYKDFIVLKKYCDKKNIIFLATPHSADAVDFLNPLVPAFKIGSGDLTNIPFLEKIARFKKPIILPTGMSDLSDIRSTVKAINKQGNNKLILLHCTTNYPCFDQEVNLRAMLTIAQAFPKNLFGYSDHTADWQTAVMAVTLGAKVIEKHFTLSKKMSGPDHKASLEPKELKEMIKSIRRVSVIMGSAIKKPTKSELIIRHKVRKSIVSLTIIKKGERFSVNNLGIKRPGTGLQPKEFKSLLGKVARKNIAADKLITKKDYVG